VVRWVVNPLGKLPCFAIPVFSDGAGCFLQTLDSSSRITCFIEANFDAETLLPLEGPSRTVGDLALYAFYYEQGSITLGAHAQVAGVVKGLVGELEQAPFLLLEIAEFLGDSKLGRQASRRCSRLLASSDNGLARRWSRAESERRTRLKGNKSPTDSVVRPRYTLNKLRSEELEERVYDLIGIGFGPSNLALAVAIREDAESASVKPKSFLFLESKEAFAWHPDMLVDSARTRSSFMKDLVTLRNPDSRFSFLVYLQESGRLVDFVNLRKFFPSRAEFNDYYRWAAEQVQDLVSYGSRVTAIEAVEEAGGRVQLLRIRYQRLKDGSTFSCLTRNLVYATGGCPKFPPGVSTTDDGRVFHSQNFLSQLCANFPDDRATHQFLVVGSGQSAAEIFQYLYKHYPNADVTATLRRFAYQPANESHFANTIFHPEMTDFLYDLPKADRKRLIAEHYDTIYSAVDLDLLAEIYRELFERRVIGNEQIRICSMLELRRIELLENGQVRAEFFNLVKRSTEYWNADGIILATGFRRNGIPPLLESLTGYLQQDHQGSFEVDRSYRISAADGFAPQIFLQGFCESTHGLSDTLLSVLPVRAKEILDALDGDSVAVGTSTSQQSQIPGMSSPHPDWRLSLRRGS